MDITFGFDYNGALKTDLYQKDTDARAYLHFSSCHPNHVFSSIVYSQALRFRRIVNDNYKLFKHLDTLKDTFFKAGYPKNMVNNIINKVKNLPRNLGKKAIDPKRDGDSIRVVSTYGNDEPLIRAVKDTTELIKSAKIYSAKKVDKPYQYTKKVAPSLRSIMCNSQRVGMGPKNGITQACRKNRCLSCKLIYSKETIVLNKKMFRTAPGNCGTDVTIYGGICTYNSCQAPYVGKTTQALHKRINGHRSAYGEYCDKNGNIDSQMDLDRYAIGIHLYRAHGLKNLMAFDSHIQFFILENCQPKNLAVREHLWIQKVRSIFPEGMNLNSPFSIPLLY